VPPQPKKQTQCFVGSSETQSTSAVQLLEQTLGPATQELPASGKVSKDKHDPLAQSESAPQGDPACVEVAPHADNHNAATHNSTNERSLLIMFKASQRVCRVCIVVFSNVRRAFELR